MILFLLIYLFIGLIVAAMTIVVFQDNPDMDRTGLAITTTFGWPGTIAGFLYIALRDEDD